MIEGALSGCQRRAAVLATALAVLSVVAPARPAWALGDFFGAEGAFFSNTLHGHGAIDDGGVSGTPFDLRDDFGLDDRDTAKMARLWFRFGKNRLFADYLDTSHDGGDVFSAPFTFHGTTYAAGESFDASTSLKLSQGRWRYSFINLKVIEMGIGLGLDDAKVRMAVDGAVHGRETLDKSLIFPTANAGLVITPVPGFHIRVEGEILSVHYGSDHVRFRDARAQLEWSFVHVVGLFAGWRTVHLDADSGDFGSAVIGQSGPYAGVGVRF